MEPKLPRPNMSPETPAATPNIQHEIPAVPAVETAPEAQKGPERQHNAVADDTALKAASQASSALPAPIIQAAPSTPAAGEGSDTTAPLVAKDEDRIEKEWVDKAKKVVAETREDPHKQSHEVSKMQTDYLYKRFGKQINLPNDS